METLRLSRSSRFSRPAVAVLLTCLSLGFATGSEAQDPANLGPYTVATTSYDDGNSAFRPTGFPINVEVRATVHHPANMTLGPFPLVVFLHGRHNTCFSGSSAVLQWPCTSGRQPIPSHEGYDYVGELLASHGFIVVSISANGINARDNDVFDLGMRARAELIQHHLQKWNTWNSSSSSPFGSLFVGRVDLDNIGTMGHSRGGEGVVRHFELNRSQGSPFGIQAVLPLAPTDFNRTVANRVALGVMLPYCDGDVSDLQGVHFYDDARYNVPGDDSFKHTFLMMGANHNYYNTVWTPGLFPAGASDDWSPFYSSDPHCGPSAASRLSAAEQRGGASAYITGFFRRYLAEETEYMPLLTTGAPEPLSAMGAEVHVSFHAPDQSNMRRDVNRMLSSTNLTTNTLGGAVTRSGLSPYRVCGGPSPQPLHCLSGQVDARQPHTTRSFLSSLRGLSQLELGWNSTSAHWTNQLPTGQRNISGFAYLQFRAGVDFTDSRNPTGAAQDLSVRLTDGAGVSRTARVGSYANPLFDPPGSFSSVPKLFLNTVRIPVKSAFGGINLNDVRSIEFRFDRRSTGGIMVTDLAFSNIEPPQTTACCNTTSISEREIYLLGNTRWSVSGNSVSYCATGTVQPTAPGGNCYVSYDEVENEWEFLTNDATCLFQCIWRPTACPSVTPATFTREFTFIETTGTRSEQLTFDEDDFSICATAGTIPLTTGGYCYVNQDGDDDTWELIARGASCNFSCIPQSSVCGTQTSREILLSGTGSLVLDDDAYPYCGTGGQIPKSNGTGYCQNNHDGDDDTWELAGRGADFCNYFCLRD